MDGRLVIELLGRMRILRQGMPVRGLEPPRLRQLLARLVLAAGAPLERAELAYQFWPDSTDAQARTNLRKLLHQLLRRLPHADLFVESDTHFLLWRKDAPCRVDVHEFVRCAGDETPGRWEAAVKLYVGALLPGFYDDWVLTERSRLRDLYLDVLDRLVAFNEDNGEFARAAEMVELRVREAPYDEPSWERLMRLLAATGNRAGAMAAYDRCCKLLSEELGAAPSEAIVQLYERLQRAAGASRTAEGVATGAAAAYARASSTGPLPLVGRERERAAIHGWCHHALTKKRPVFVLVTGEAGIGKTRLAEDATEWAAAQGVAVAVTRAYQWDQAAALAPVRSLLRTDALQAAVAELPINIRRQLAVLLPDARDAFAAAAETPALFAAGGASVPEWSTGDWRRRELFASLTQAVLAVSHPLLVIVDDLHWWDDAGVAWLHYFFSRIEAVPVAVLATVRAEEDMTPALTAMIASLQSHGRLRRLELGPLSYEGTRSLLEEIRHRDDTPDLVERAYAETEGNPLFILEWLEAHAMGLGTDSGVSEPYVDPVSGLPGRMHGIITGRLLRLSSPARDVADAGAVHGRQLTWRFIRAVTGMEEETLVAALEELCQRRVLRERDDGSYDFAHARIRDVLLTGLSTARRRYLHERAAGALLSVYGKLPGTEAARVAAHYEQAGYSVSAAACYLVAARHAESVYANEAALALYRQGISAVSSAGVLADGEGLPAGVPPGVELGYVARMEGESDLEPGTLAAALWEGLGDVQLRLGRHDEAREAFAEAAQRLAKRTSSATDHVARARLLRKLGNTVRERQRYAEAEEYYRQAEDVLPSPSPDWMGLITAAANEWADLQLDRLTLLYRVGRTSDMQVIVERLGPVIEQCAKAERRFRYHHALATMLHRQERFVTSKETLVHGPAQLKAAQEASEPQLLAEARFSYGFLLLWHGDTENAERYLEEALAGADVTGDVLLRVRVLLYLCFLRRRQDDAEQVIALSNEVVALSERAGFDEYVAAGLAHRAWAALRRGERARARSDAEEALALWDRGQLAYPFVWTAAWPLMVLYLEDERDAEAVVLAERLRSPEQQRLPMPVESALQRALAGWDQSRPAAAKAGLLDALTAAREAGFG